MQALAVYGTLRPGESNHWLLRPIAGEWVAGTVRGYEFEIGWGPVEGYPGIMLDKGGQDIKVEVLISNHLDGHIGEIDDFEGPGYRRVKCVATLDDGRLVDAWIYEAVPDVDDA